MKKTLRFIAFTLVAVMLLSTVLTSCSWLDELLGKTTTTTQKAECVHADTDADGLCDECGQILEIQNTDSSFSYYANTKLPEDKKIYVLNMTSEGYNFSEDETFTAQAIQGLFARKSALFYLDSHYMTNGVNIDMHYLDLAVENYGITYESISLEEAVAMYIANWEANVADGTWGSAISLDSYNSIPGVTAYTETSGEGYSTPGYIVYKKGDVSVNIAATLAGITGFLPVCEDDVAKYQALGLVEKFNVNSAALTYKWLFNNVMSELNTSGLIHQNYQSVGLTNKFIKDYGICNKYFHVYYDEVSIVGNSFKKTLHSFLDDNSPIFGYTYSEDSDVAFFSQYGQFIVPTDYTCNLTFLAADAFAGKKFEQPNDDSELPAEQGKHYVAFVVSDGDNATYWQNTAAFATNYMNAAGRENDTFPVTWSITPSLADLMPLVLENVYNNQANAYDYFCAPVSGQGYINAGNFEAEKDGKYFADFVSKLDVYMGKSDLSVVTVIGGNQQGDLVNVLHGYASAENVTGGIVYDGSKYFGANPGGVIWIDGKPFVQPRDSLWETTPAYIAARINTYPTDITTIDAYSIINVHPWSHSYEDIRKIVGMLNENVEVVSVDRLINMMTDNVADKSNTTSMKVPEKNGISISQGYLQENPSLIPVDSLYNDFLLWAEDWSGSGVTYNSSDKACSNVGAIYKGNISIAAGATATKAAFTLPDIDNYWLSFNARGDSLDPLQTGTFDVILTIGGETKTVMSNVTLRGVSGTETMTVNGDGWQCFAFPLDQYFPNYRGQSCEMKIVVHSGGTGIRLDQVTFKDRFVDPAIDQSGVDVYNNTFNETTEDWMLGEQYKTSQYYWWSTIDREDLSPTGTIQIDCSDGGGDEKRNGNTNIWMAKHYTLPESDNISLKFTVTSDNDTGAYIKISLYVEGKYFVLYDWQPARGSFNNTNVTIDLSELDPSIDFSGAEVTVVFEARDGGRNNGVGEACKLHDFQTISK
ncbi:MAG: hypothetical protein IKM40_03405 [Clostridia bacterium]|nr:hypothetical protein [Clostridia bacterium]